MPVLGIDIETYSSADLKRCGVYRYVEAPDFEILLFGYALDDEPVHVIDLTEQSIPGEILGMLLDPGIVKQAFNANFERVCLSRHLGQTLPPEQWQCTAVHASMLGLPRTLEQVGKLLGLPEDEQKMKEGKALISYFCVPCKPTKTNGGRTRNLPHHDVEKWNTFIEYNRRDVEVERNIRHIMEKFPVRPEELEAYWIDQHVNDHGIRIDQRLADEAIRISKERKAELTAEAKALTGLDNVNSVSQLKKWLGVEGSLNKNVIADMRAGGELDETADRVLAIRQENGKSSVSKYEAMKRSVCSDGRVHGVLQFYGAPRTGRWAGKLVQVQNLPQNQIDDLDAARALLRTGDAEMIQMCYGSLSMVLSQLVRTAFVAGEGKTFVVADYSAIEARVLAWLADEVWRMDLFAKGGDIYCQSASAMFHVPVVKHGVNGHLRQKGKIAELACGYGGSVPAMINMGALRMGLKEEELKPIVDAWRESNPAITKFWWQIDAAVNETVSARLPEWRMDLPHGLSMRYTKNLLHVKLPSGRELRYWRPKIVPGRFDRDNLSYWGINEGRWMNIRSYGPKVVENIVQGIARDCLRDAMTAIHKAGLDIVMHVHDEVIVEAPKDQAEKVLQRVLEIMKTPIPWAPGLLLKGEGYITDYYKKD